jgi:Ankyrin repeats (3 copies)
MGGASSKQKSSTQEASTQKLDKQWFDTIKSDDVNKVKDLLSSVDVNLTDITGKTALYYVGDEQIAKFLIAEGANVKATDKYKFTPLHYAKNRKIAEVLIGKGADLQALSCNAFAKQDTPLSSALTYVKADVAFCIIDNFSLEQLQEKPGYLNSGSNYIYSQYWNHVKQKKETESLKIQSNSDAKVSSEVLETGMSVEKVGYTVQSIPAAVATAKKELEIASTTQAQDTLAVTETSYQSRLAESTLFTRTLTATDSEEEGLAKTEKSKVMLKH